MNTLLRSACLSVTILSLAAPVSGAIRNLPGFATTTYGANDDGSYPCTSSSAGLPDNCTPTPVPIGFTINFYSNQLSELYVNNNGNVTFGSPSSVFTPFAVTAAEVQIIAAYFGDVDTRAGNVVTFGNDVVDGHNAFGVNWINVGYFSQATDKLNSFQLILIDRSDRNPGDFDIEFNYDLVQWETGDLSGGSSGLGGNSAVVGFSNGSGLPGTSFQLSGSGIPGQFLDTNPGGLVHRSLNSTVTGRYVFPVVNLTNTVLSVPLFSQGDSRWAGNTYGTSVFTVQQKGCALAALAMALKFEGINTDPGALNNVLKANGDFVGTDINWTAGARDASGDTLEFHAFRTSDLQYLSRSLAAGHPVIVGVNLNAEGAPGHFVVVTGYRNGQFLINDPGHANDTTLASYNNQFETRGYVGDPPGDISGLGVSVDNNAELLVVDSAGRRAGFVSGLVLEETPRGFYFRDTIEDNDLTAAPGTDTAHQVDLYQPQQGVYQVFLLGTRAGPYKLTLRSFSTSGAPGSPLSFTGTMTPGAVAAFQVTLSNSGLTAQPFANQCPWSATPTTGPVPLNVDFSGPSVDALGNALTQWNWSFGDGSSSSLQSPSHSYTNGGIFFPNLTAINSAGATVVGSGPAITIPLVRFTASPTNGVPPLTVQFNSAAVDNLGHAISGWSWDFGDGSTSTQQNPSHTFNNIGLYTPRLFVTNNVGMTVPGVGPAISVLPFTGLVLNGGFESGNFLGWAESGDTTGNDVTSSYAYSGNYGAELGPMDLGYLSQTLHTTAGEAYLISLWLDSPDGATPSQFSISWGGTMLFSQSDLPAIGWTNIQLLVTAPAGSTTKLSLGYLNDSSYFGLDEVSVFPVRPAIATITATGHDLILNAANGLAGRSYRVLRSPSPTLPLNQWTPVVTNTISTYGNFSVSLPNALDPTAAQRYFRLQLQ